MKKLLTIVIFIATFMVAMASPTISKDYSVYATSILVSPESANEMITNEDNIVVLDVRKEGDFEKGHIEGSYQIWRLDFGAEKGEYAYNGMRGTSEKLAKTLGEYGITSETHIILLSAQADYDAARLWWLLDMYGHKKMSMIDGGIDGWKLAGLETVTGAVNSSMNRLIFMLCPTPGRLWNS